MFFPITALKVLRRNIFRFGFLGLAAIAVLAAAPTVSPSANEALFAQLLRPPQPSEWKDLSRFDGTLTRRAFEQRLDILFDPAHGLRPYLRYGVDLVAVYQNKEQSGDPLVILRFAPSEAQVRAQAGTFRNPEAFRRQALAASPSRPLSGLRLALEPADIGGRWAEMEDRSVLFPKYGRINEGDFNLIVGRLLRAKLTQQGAEVFLVRDRAEPILPISPDKLFADAETFLRQQPTLRAELLKNRKPLPSGDHLQLRFAAGLFLTKTLETRARAALVRRSFSPDLTIVLQHNATVDSGEGRLATTNRNIFFVHGAYGPAELADPEQRFRLLTKLLQNTTPAEVEVANAISLQFQKSTGFPPVLYGNSATTRLVLPDNPYVVARNLALNREHDGPVVVTEPYFMNEPETLSRLLAGDYPGKRLISGQWRQSIYREYADSVCEGILDAYQRNPRGNPSPGKSTLVQP